MWFNCALNFGGAGGMDTIYCVQAILSILFKPKHKKQYKNNNNNNNPHPKFSHRDLKLVSLVNQIDKKIYKEFNRVIKRDPNNFQIFRN